jgi:hypothetical protein
MASSGMLCRVALLRTNVSEELSAFFTRMKEGAILHSRRRENLKPCMREAKRCYGNFLLVCIRTASVVYKETLSLVTAAEPRDTDYHVLHIVRGGEDTEHVSAGVRRRGFRSQVLGN